MTDIFARGVLEAILAHGRVVMNDYVLSVTEIEGGHRLHIVRGSEEQTLDVMDGPKGNRGDDGYSPRVNVIALPTGVARPGVLVTIRDVTGDHQFELYHGEEGQPGKDGVSPAVSTRPVYDASTGVEVGVAVDIIDAEDLRSFMLYHGKDGTFENLTEEQREQLRGPQGLQGEIGPRGDKGDAGETGPAGPAGEVGPVGPAGFSPAVTVTNIPGGHRVTITDESGSQSFDVLDGVGGAGAVESVNGQTGAVQLTASDVGALTADELSGAVDDALAQAKASGEFDGPQGAQGPQGEPGVSPTVEITGIAGTSGKNGNKIKITDANGVVHVAEVYDGAHGSNGVSPTFEILNKSATETSPRATQITITGAQGSQKTTIYDGATGPQGPAGPAGADGQPGQQGEPGKDGVSATHSWNGTVLTITSASGTSSADLKGEKGDKGDTGGTGPAGVDGKTPVKGTDYWTAADKSAMVSDVLAALPTWNGGSY